ncbi:MAG: hypothetical protein ABIQ64_00220 [Candidatus Saccharimonadales bacterium]
MSNETQNVSNIQTNLIRVILGTAAILSAPLIAMIFTDEVKWGPFDFIVIGSLLIVAGTAYTILADRMKESRHRFALLCVTVLTVLYLWAELAVGIFTNWGS